MATTIFCQHWAPSLPCPDCMQKSVSTDPTAAPKRGTEPSTETNKGCVLSSFMQWIKKSFCCLTEALLSGRFNPPTSSKPKLWQDVSGDVKLAGGGEASSWRFDSIRGRRGSEEPLALRKHQLACPRGHSTL